MPSEQRQVPAGEQKETVSIHPPMESLQLRFLAYGTLGNNVFDSKQTDLAVTPAQAQEIIKQPTIPFQDLTKASHTECSKAWKGVAYDQAYRVWSESMTSQAAHDAEKSAFLLSFLGKDPAATKTVTQQEIDELYQNSIGDHSLMVRFNNRILDMCKTEQGAFSRELFLQQKDKISWLASRLYGTETVGIILTEVMDAVCRIKDPATREELTTSFQPKNETTPSPLNTPSDGEKQLLDQYVQLLNGETVTPEPQATTPTETTHEHTKTPTPPEPATPSPTEATVEPTDSSPTPPEPAILAETPARSETPTPKEPTTETPDAITPVPHPETPLIAMTSAINIIKPYKPSTEPKEEIPPKELLFRQFLGKAEELIRAGNYQEAIDYLKNSDADLKAREFGYYISAGRTQFFKEPIPQNEIANIANLIAYWSRFNEKSINIGGVVCYDQSEPPKPIPLPKELAHEIALVALEEWLHALQHYGKKPLAGYEYDEIDVAAYMKKQNIPVTSTFMARYDRDKILSGTEEDVPALRRGTFIKVKRSNGAIEDGWQIVRFDSKENCAIAVNVKQGIEKPIPLEEIADLNPVESQPFTQAHSLDEVFGIIDSYEGIYGFQEFFTAKELRHVITEVSRLNLSLDYIPRAGGLGAKIKEILKM